MIPIMVAEAMTTTKWQSRLNFIIPQPEFNIKKILPTQTCDHCFPVTKLIYSFA